MLEIKNLQVKLEDEDKQILKGLDLTVETGKVHAIMGQWLWQVDFVLRVVGQRRL